MKIVKSKTLTEYCQYEYQDFICEYTLTNNIVSSVRFSRKSGDFKDDLRSVTDLKSLRNNLWPEHNKFTKNDWVEEEIFNFSDFDNLFFVSSYNGLVYDNQGGLISVLTRIDDITFAKSYDI